MAMEIERRFLFVFFVEVVETRDHLLFECSFFVEVGWGKTC